MSKTPVDECPAGREMDAAIEEILGYSGYFSDYILINNQRYDIKTWIWKDWTPEDPPKGWRPGIMPRNYSADIAAAWELAEWLVQNHEFYITNFYNPGGWSASYRKKSGSDWIPSDTKTAPLAICRAFLKANGIEYVEVPE